MSARTFAVSMAVLAVLGLLGYGLLTKGEDKLAIGQAIPSRDVSSDGLAFVEELGLTYPQLHDSEGGVPDELGMTGFPESFLVDPEGKIALAQPGPVTDQYLDEMVAPLIEAS